MPFVRGRILPEVELAGRAKEFLDILIWAERLDRTDTVSLDELDLLRAYLRSLEPFVCYIRLFVPKRHLQTAATLDEIRIEYQVVAEQDADAEAVAGFKQADGELLTAVGTALSVDADCLAVNRREWLPFTEESDKLGFLLTDCSFCYRIARCSRAATMYLGPFVTSHGMHLGQLSTRCQRSRLSRLASKLFTALTRRKLPRMRWRRDESSCTIVCRICVSRGTGYCSTKSSV
jgi:hypothetical protein